jgi:hypothetical protein
MPNPPKKPYDEKFQFGVSALVNRRQLDAIERIMDRDGITKGAAVRVLLDRGIEHELTT